MSDPSRGQHPDYAPAETAIRTGKYVVTIEFPFQEGGSKRAIETVTVQEGWDRSRIEQTVKTAIGSVGLHNFGLKVDEDGTAQIRVSLADSKTYDPGGENQAIASFSYRVNREGHAS